MIPVKLTLHNFMCYRNNVPPVSFDGIQLACLSGDNGSGKSALVDAITWALWGETRAKSDDDLIHTGEREMSVEFDFAVGEQIYRIIRKRTKARRPGSQGQPILELQIASEGGFRSISDVSISLTQQKIIEILHMDYTTFVNSAYLQQGHADEFTRQPPAKRKEVLANILGLSRYDELEEQAKELSRQREAERTQLESSIKEITEELSNKPAYEAELGQAQTELSQIDATLKEKENRVNKLREERESLEKKKVQLEQLETHQREIMRDLARWNEQSKQYHQRIEEYETLIARRVSIEAGYSRFTEARKLNDELDQKFRKMASLNQQKHYLEMTIARASQELVKEHALTQNKIGELETRSQKLPELKNQLNQTHLQLPQITQREETLANTRQARETLQTQVNYLESSNTQLVREIKEVGEKLDLLSSQTEAKCPLCERELETYSLKLIETKYVAEKQNKSAQLKQNQSESAHKRTQLEALVKELSHLESQLNQERASLQTKMNVLTKEISEAQEAAKQVVEERQKLDEIENRLAMKDFAAVEQAALHELEIELARLNYGAEQHEQVRRQLTELERYDQAKRKLEEADRLINQERQTLAKAESAAQQLRQNSELDYQKAQALKAELTLLPQLLDSLGEAETELKALVEQRSQAQELVGSVKSKLQRCAELELRKEEKTRLVAQATEQESIYKELAKAFGKGGIQALLIEMALPEIEAEANRLLGRMTDNRMHVKFETQRQTKTGSVLETLDINISDELGTRNYEMFSGGEAFRINFAIRIALSKLLARRAGAPLPTLIIDEGFGTQDSTGIERLKEAISSIQDDFDKIIVITHMEELRDAFPTRIDVVKTANGSTILVN